MLVLSNGQYAGGGDDGIGDGLNLARKKIILSKIEIPHWSYRDAIKYKNIVKS